MTSELAIQAGIYGAQMARRHRRLKDALQKIANLKEADCEKYVAKCDEIALDALMVDHEEDVGE